jgi:hypothetical protein
MSSRKEDINAEKEEEDLKVPHPRHPWAEKSDNVKWRREEACTRHAINLLTVSTVMLKFQCEEEPVGSWLRFRI